MESFERFGRHHKDERLLMDMHDLEWVGYWTPDRPYQLYRFKDNAKWHDTKRVPEYQHVYAVKGWRNRLRIWLHVRRRYHKLYVVKNDTSERNGIMN